jgi:hypothetical protein
VGVTKKSHAERMGAVKKSHAFNMRFPCGSDAIGMRFHFNKDTVICASRKATKILRYIAKVGLDTVSPHLLARIDFLD